MAQAEIAQLKTRRSVTKREIDRFEAALARMQRDGGSGEWWDTVEREAMEEQLKDLQAELAEIEGSLKEAEK